MINLFSPEIHLRHQSQWEPRKKCYVRQHPLKFIQHYLLPVNMSSSIDLLDGQDFPQIRKIYFLHRLIQFHY